MYMCTQPPSPPREAPRKKKPRSKEFSMFEKTGMIMGMVRNESKKTLEHYSSIISLLFIFHSQSMPQPGVGIPSLTSPSPFTTQPPFKGEAESSASGPTDSSRSEQRKAEGWKKMAKPVLPTPIPPLSPTTTSPLSPISTQPLHLPTRDQEKSPTSEESAETSVQQRRGRGRVASNSADQERGREAGGGRKRDEDAGLVFEAAHTLRHVSHHTPPTPYTCNYNTESLVFYTLETSAISLCSSQRVDRKDRPIGGCQPRRARTLGWQKTSQLQQCRGKKERDREEAWNNTTRRMRGNRRGRERGRRWVRKRRERLSRQKQQTVAETRRAPGKREKER